MAAFVVEADRDHGERERDDRRDTRRQPVHAVGEVDDVHQRHEADDGDHATLVRELQQAHERQRDVLHDDSVVHDDQRREHLPAELQDGVQVEAVVERADDRDHGRREEHPVPVHRPRSGAAARFARGQPDERRHERAREDREPAEERHGSLGEAPVARFVDSADGPREAHRQRSQERGHGPRHQKGVERVKLCRVHSACSQDRTRAGRMPRACRGVYGPATLTAGVPVMSPSYSG